ncbi:PREDICTED: uncharacterized protein LOC105455134 [Wasmannia auropunctata]|uniref:uncharacterized protein LOC105455134 n=1 Tax=Wasmannia auropunctata TaxID=64793 RepID=UPI0005EE84F8|nr:PREDICTED: uncharacterized protein LOC105455134 [Wasmannia auropunctata]
MSCSKYNLECMPEYVCKDHRQACMYRSGAPLYSGVERRPRSRAVPARIFWIFCSKCSQECQDMCARIIARCVWQIQWVDVGEGRSPDSSTGTSSRLKLPRGSFRPGTTDQTVTEFRTRPRAMLAKFLEQIIMRVVYAVSRHLSQERPSVFHNVLPLALHCSCYTKRRRKSNNDTNTDEKLRNRLSFTFNSLKDIVYSDGTCAKVIVIASSPHGT